MEGFIKADGGDVKILEKLKAKNYRLFALSNFIKEAYDYVRRKYSFFNYFEGIVISSEIKSIKPQRRMYTKLIDCYKISPVESLFIDDSEESLKAAAKSGIRTVQFKSPEQLRKELIRLGLL